MGWVGKLPNPYLRRQCKLGDAKIRWTARWTPRSDFGVHMSPTLLYDINSGVPFCTPPLGTNGVAICKLASAAGELGALHTIQGCLCLAEESIRFPVESQGFPGIPAARHNHPPSGQGEHREVHPPAKLPWITAPGRQIRSTRSGGHAVNTCSGTIDETGAELPLLGPSRVLHSTSYWRLLPNSKLTPTPFRCGGGSKSAHSPPLTDNRLDADSAGGPEPVVWSM